MPYGKGTYGSKKGRPPKKIKKSQQKKSKAMKGFVKKRKMQGRGGIYG